ncbi:helix-turn-helix domain-containing protein [Labrenzia sp. PHM005]|uniref:helix-turn-helix domain-containing protein n=1 Tax=Labrenzia sp. PHM005 TaxID=2590016 RepID=UPI00113FFC44|nr:helix-turn-helix transcriptional regulator [Labrenzia sp. PHM005]QDG78372.1 helix-turn-helix domain-containing protein [Labrenzia sp. PHM005]
MSENHTAFPSLLKTWRSRRRLSQLDLALEAGLSQRHISFLETGRSQPSRAAIAQLGFALQMPAAEIDTLLISAGFAAPSMDTRWSADTRTAVQASIDHVLAGHEPFPAFSVDRIWSIQKANAAAQSFFGEIGNVTELNILRAIMMPGPVRDSLVNWQPNTRALMRLLEMEVARRPNDLDAQALLKELVELPGVREALESAPTSAPVPVLTMNFTVGDADLNLFSMIATIGMSADAALDDIRIETLLPADDATRNWFLARVH